MKISKIEVERALWRIAGVRETFAPSERLGYTRLRALAKKIDPSWRFQPEKRIPPGHLNTAIRFFDRDPSRQEVIQEKTTFPGQRKTLHQSSENAFFDFS